jgi:hypothetical protein
MRNKKLVHHGRERVQVRLPITQTASKQLTRVKSL